MKMNILIYFTLTLWKISFLTIIFKNKSHQPPACAWNLIVLYSLTFPEESKKLFFWSLGILYVYIAVIGMRSRGHLTISFDKTSFSETNMWTWNHFLPNYRLFFPAQLYFKVMKGISLCVTPLPWEQRIKHNKSHTCHQGSFKWLPYT